MGINDLHVVELRHQKLIFILPNKGQLQILPSYFAKWKLIKIQRCHPPPALAVEKRKGSRSKNGMPLHFGRGTSWSIIAPFAETTSWIFVLNVRQIRPL